MAKQKKMILGSDIIKDSFEFNTNRIKESQEAIQYLQEVCEHDFMYHEYYDSGDWEICKYCGKTNRLPIEMLGIGHEK